MTCCVTGKSNPDLHHIKHRGAGGPDTEWNLMPLSRKLHQEWHQIGPSKFLKKYPQAKLWLIAHGWEILENGKLFHKMLVSNHG